MNSSDTALKHGRWYYIKWIFFQYKNRVFLVFMLFFLTILSTVVSVLFPLLFKSIIDDLVKNISAFREGNFAMSNALGEHNRSLLLLLALGIGSWFTGFYPFLRGRTNQILEMFFRESYFAEILEKGHRFFLHFRTGDLVTRLTEDVRNYPPGLSWLCCSGIFRAVNSSCIIFFCLISMCWLNLKLTLLAIIPLPFLLFLFLKLETTIERRYKKLQESVSEINDFLESAFSGIKIVKSFNSETPKTSLFKKLMDKRIDLEVDVIKVSGFMNVYFEFMSYFGQVLVLLFGGIMVVQKQLSIGEYYAFFSYLGMIVFPLIDIPMMFVTLAQSFVAIDRLEEIEQQDSEWRDETTGNQAPTDIQSIEFKNVCFSYDHQCQIPLKEHPRELDSVTKTFEPEKEPFEIREVSFSLETGKKIAVVGRIGSGKTTLLNLAAGILAPSLGEILINGTPLSQVNKHTLRKMIGFIQQEPTIFSDTVSTNINFWRGFEQNWIEKCAQLSQLDNEIRLFPKGYEEQIGQRGVTLSGGQKQRLSIARALAGNPKFLLMDDVTSSLDSENEMRFWEEIKSSFPKITFLIVTHRLSSAQNADKILVLDNGRISAMDTHQNLLNTNAIYQELARH